MVRLAGASRRGIAAVILCVLLGSSLGGCADAGPGAGTEAAVRMDAEAGAEPRAAESGEATLMQIVDILVPGPAEGRDPGALNRIGSAQVSARLYEPVAEAWATLVWAHGGSFVRGTLDWPEADWAARRFAEAGLRVYSVDYALASDVVKAPAPSNDMAAVLRWVAAEHPGPIVAGGASAGAHLAVLAALAQAEVAAARPADALILQYPTLHRVQREDPAIAAATAGLPEQRRFGAERIAEMYAYYLGEGAPGAGPGTSTGGDSGAVAGIAAVAGELSAGLLAVLPPTVIVNAELDDLRASGEQFAEQLRAAGVPVVEHVQAGTVHGYLNRPEESDRARRDAGASIDRFVTELRAILS